MKIKNKYKTGSKRAYKYNKQNIGCGLIGQGWCTRQDRRWAKSGWPKNPGMTSGGNSHPPGV